MAENKELIEGQKEPWENIESWFTANRNVVLGVLTVLILGIGGILGYKNLYVAPREGQAQDRIFHAQKYFQQDSLQLALNGDGLNPGFSQITKQYGMTPTGKLAHGYAAICNLRLGNHAEAIKHGKKYSGDDEWLTSRVYTTLGHANGEKGDLNTAMRWYERAAMASENEITTPRNYYLAGMTAMEVKDYRSATNFFAKIKDGYPQSQEGRNIDKYIALAEELQ